MGHYSEKWWYSTGGLATNQRAVVFEENDNVLAAIYSDAGLTIPLPNPTTTDANGVLEFYAADGAYWVFVGRIDSGNSELIRTGATPTGPVLSVNGQLPDMVGNVTLTSGDVGAQPIDTIVAKGDIYAGTGAGAVSRLAVGTDDYLLIADSTQATGLNWRSHSTFVESVNGLQGDVTLTALDVQAQPLTTIQAKGDLYIGTGNDASTNLSIGTDGYVLTADSGTAEGASWQPAPSSGGDVVGPASSTDNGIPRFDGMSGKILQGSGITITDIDAIVMPGASGIPPDAGSLYRNGDNQLAFLGEDIHILLGYETYIEVVNTTGSPISAGSVVYINGASSGIPTIALAQANSLTTARAVGITENAIADSTTGYAVIKGHCVGIDTSAFSEGDQLYVSAATPGALTNVAPSYPNFVTPVGIVSFSNAGGRINVSVETPVLGNGSNGQFEMMLSTASGGRVMQTPLSFTSHPSSLGWTIPGGVPFARQALTMTLNAMYLTPFALAVDATLGNLSFEVTSVTPSSVVRGGIYAAHPTTYRPTGLPIADFGTVATSGAPGAHAFIVSVDLAPGVYYTALVAQTAAPAIRFTQGISPYVQPSAFPGGATAAMNNGWFETGIAGALTSIGTISDTVAPLQGLAFS